MGLLNFTYLSQMLTEEDSEDLLKRFHQTNARKNRHQPCINRNDIKKKIEDSSSKSSLNEHQKDEKRIQSCKCP